MFSVKILPWQLLKYILENPILLRFSLLIPILSSKTTAGLNPEKILLFIENEAPSFTYIAS